MFSESHVSDLLPAYALDCLDEEETLAVSKHLTECGQCRSELRIYQEVADQLPSVVPQVEPPSRVKEGLMKRVQAGSRLERSSPSASSWLDSLINFFRKASPVWSLASLALIVVLAASNLLLWQQMRQLNVSPLSPHMSVLNLSGTDAAPGASGLMVVSSDGDHGTLVADHLPPLGQDQQYQLWLIKDGARTSGGVFSVDHDGYGSLWVSSPLPLVQYSAFGVTIEPQGGSPGPTGLKVLSGEF
jgi:anti-sigma-K factor RskA